MNIRAWQWTLAVLIFSGLVYALSGCNLATVHRTEIHDLPGEVRVKLSRGDTKEKVRSVLGTPLIDAQSFGVEVYSHSGQDWLITVIIVPLPNPDKYTVFTLVVYDENEVVRDISTDIWAHYYDPSNESGTFWMTAGGYSFVNDGAYMRYLGEDPKEPHTLLGPSISWEELAEMAIPEGSCSLVLVMGRCPMEQVSLDTRLIVDLKDAADLSFCGLREDTCFLKNTVNHFCGTFTQKIISSGSHHLKISQESMTLKVETVFECVTGETVYAELKADHIPDWWSGRYEGEITISKKPTKSIIEMGRLSPILWHRGAWYGQTTSPAAASQ